MKRGYLVTADVGGLFRVLAMTLCQDWAWDLLYSAETLYSECFPLKDRGMAVGGGPNSFQ